MNHIIDLSCPTLRKKIQYTKSRVPAARVQKVSLLINNTYGVMLLVTSWFLFPSLS